MSEDGTALRRRMLAVFEEVVDLAPDARAARLATLCAGDAVLRAKVDAMLAADEAPTEPFPGGMQAWAALVPDPAAAIAGLEARAGQCIGAWRITGLLGRGGMGAVHAVERADGAYVQRAALKRVQVGDASAASRERFLRERQVLARLQHPHIATLLDGGFDDGGDPYFVMERVDGVPIDRWCDAQRLGLRARVVLFLQVLDAVQYAHRNLVVHRDLKPSNLLVTAEGRVKLLDFGIARDLGDAARNATATIDRAMTLQYASPEQLNNEAITTATDVYQLGVVLYRLLSGRHPFRIEADSPLAHQLQALSRDPEPIARSARQSEAEVAALRGESPASLARALEGSLAAVVHACLRREAGLRYASVEAVAVDLRAWLDDRPVLAATPGRGQRARLWLRRNRVFAAAGAAVAVALLAGTALALWQAREAREQARIAVRESTSARAAMQFLTDTLGAANPEQSLSAEVGVRELLDHARANLEREGALDPAVLQPVQRMLGRLYVAIGDSQGAIGLFAAGTQDTQPQGRAEALALADDLVAYSDAADHLEQSDLAFALAERAVALRRQFAPDDSEQELRALAHLTLGHVARMGLEGARQQAERALALSRTLPAPPVEVVLDIHSDLGVAAIFQNDRARMMSVAREGLAFADAHGVPADHPQRLGLLRNLANGLVMEERYAEAERVVREGIASIARTGGEGSTSRSVLLQALADALGGQGRYHEMRTVLEQGHATTLRGNNGPRNLATELSNQAVTASWLGDYPRALALSERGMAQLDAGHVVADDLFRRSLARTHARILLANGRRAEAQALLEDLRERARRLDGDDAEEVAMATYDLVPVALDAGEPERAAQLLAEARERLAQRGIPATHRRFATLLRMEARLARAQGDLATAIARQRDAVRQLGAGPNPVDAAAAAAELAELLATQGQAREARQVLDQAVPVLRDAVLETEASRALGEALVAKLAR